MAISALLVALSAQAQLPKGFLRGGDVSEIPQVEDLGGKFLLDGKPLDPFELMKRSGWNFVRLRVWNAPKDSYCDKQHTLALAKRAKALGFAISIDFHYSDWWADPGKQYKPAAWKALPFEQLTQAVYDYTKDVVSALVAQGTPPLMVQVGNEITAGMLWPDGRVNSDKPEQWSHLSLLLKAGIKAVHDSETGQRIRTMIHLDRGGDNGGAEWWFDHIAPYDVPFDDIGLSYYPFWHGHIDKLQPNLDALAKKYRKDVYVVETAYPWTNEVAGRGSERVFADPKKLEPDFPATPEGEANFIRRVEQALLAVPGHRGKGILYWAPLWIATPKGPTAWDNMALFDFKGNALAAMKALGGKK